ncbi:MAG: hypothetical protein VKP63_09065 [Cyanobacteriota bacterium]|nr:hypothetical protein [Cyanobacteriota bacterium]
MAWTMDAGSDSDPPPPITPHAAPSLDARGQLSYVGEDGRRYVVGLPPEIDQASLERVMATLRQGGVLFHEIEQLARRWIQEVSGPDLDGRAALVLLVTTLETSLEELFPDEDSPASPAES